MALDENSETFVIHIAFVNPGNHPDRKVQIAFLLTKEVKISEEYLDFTNVFLKKKALVLPKHNKLNEHAIDLEDGKQPLYWQIYSLSPVKLENLKTYIKTYLKTRFIQPSKSPTNAPILFDKKSNGSLCLCIDY